MKNREIARRVRRIVKDADRVDFLNAKIAAYRAELREIEDRSSWTRYMGPGMCQDTYEIMSALGYSAPGQDFADRAEKCNSASQWRRFLS